MREGRVSAEMTIVASQGNNFLGEKVACQGNNLTEFTNDGDALMRQTESRKKGGEGKVSAEMIVASQGNDFLGDKVAFQGDNLTEFTNDGDTLDIVACDAIQCNNSASALLDMLRRLDKDTVRCKGAQTEEKDLHLPDEWVFPKPRGICEPVWAVVGDNYLPASKRTREPVYAGAQEAESKKSLVDDPVAKRTRSSRTRESVYAGAQEAKNKNSLVDDPVAKRTCSSRSCEPVYASAQEANNKNSLVDDPVAKRACSSADEIGIILKSEKSDKTKVCLRDIGSYVMFSSQECKHKGYKSGNVKTYLSAQLFSAPNGKRQEARKEGATYEKGSIKGELLSQLKAISKAIQQGWEKYMNRKYNASIRF